MKTINGTEIEQINETDVISKTSNMNKIILKVLIFMVVPALTSSEQTLLGKPEPLIDSIVIKQSTAKEHVKKTDSIIAMNRKIIDRKIDSVLKARTAVDTVYVVVNEVPVKKRNWLQRIFKPKNKSQ